MGNPAGVLAETALFSGRHAELETLRRLLTSAAEGEVATVVITGEYGVGKTALVTRSGQRSLCLGFLCCRGERRAP